MNAPSWEDAPPPAPLPHAPDRAATPLPGTFTLSLDPGTAALEGGSVLMGGSPLRLLRLSTRAQNLVASWQSEKVGEGRAAQLLARRLVTAGIGQCRPTASTFGSRDVTVVIPVRDRADQLTRLLSALAGLICVVVDDASTDRGRIEEIARAHDAAFVGLATNVGPSGARNAGLAVATSPLVAFVDSDCIPAEGWLLPLLGYFDDPLVGAVAPRVIPAPVIPPTWISRYEAVRSSLDRGTKAGLVRSPGSISYVPSATIVVRRSATGTPFFDPALRGGEDVDLVWRLAAAGWDIHYVPSATVAHEGPATPRSWLGRRVFYGTTAGPLALRHPEALAPLQTSVWVAASWGLLAARRPLWAAGTLTTSILILARRLDRLVDDPLAVATTIAGGGTIKAAVPALSGLTRAWSPALALGLLSRRTRRAAALALAVPAVADWISNRGALDPVRYTAAHVADDLAYGTGVWRGCLRARTLRPLIPRIAVRSRVWSTSSVRSQLGGATGTGAESAV